MDLGEKDTDFSRQRYKDRYDYLKDKPVLDCVGAVRSVSTLSRMSTTSSFDGKKSARACGSNTNLPFYMFSPTPSRKSQTCGDNKSLLLPSGRRNQLVIPLKQSQYRKLHNQFALPPLLRSSTPKSSACTDKWDADKRGCGRFIDSRFPDIHKKNMKPTLGKYDAPLISRPTKLPCPPKDRNIQYARVPVIKGFAIVSDRVPGDFTKVSFHSSKTSTEKKVNCVEKNGIEKVELSLSKKLIEKNSLRAYREHQDSVLISCVPSPCCLPEPVSQVVEKGVFADEMCVSLNKKLIIKSDKLNCKDCLRPASMKHSQSTMKFLKENQETVLDCRNCVVSSAVEDAYQLPVPIDGCAIDVEKSKLRSLIALQRKQRLMKQKEKELLLKRQLNQDCENEIVRHISRTKLDIDDRHSDVESDTCDQTNGHDHFKVSERSESRSNSTNMEDYFDHSGGKSNTEQADNQAVVELNSYIELSLERQCRKTGLKTKFHSEESCIESDKDSTIVGNIRSILNDGVGHIKPTEVLQLLNSQIKFHYNLHKTEDLSNTPQTNKQTHTHIVSERKRSSEQQYDNSDSGVSLHSGRCITKEPQNNRVTVPTSEKVIHVENSKLRSVVALQRKQQLMKQNEKELLLNRQTSQDFENEIVRHSYKNHFESVRSFVVLGSVSQHSRPKLDIDDRHSDVESDTYDNDNGRDHFKVSERSESRSNSRLRSVIASQQKQRMTKQKARELLLNRQINKDCDEEEIISYSYEDDFESGGSSADVSLIAQPTAEMCDTDNSHSDFESVTIDEDNDTGYKRKTDFFLNRKKIEDSLDVVTLSLPHFEKTGMKLQSDDDLMEEVDKLLFELRELETVRKGEGFVLKPVPTPSQQPVNDEREETFGQRFTFQMNTPQSK